ncbi:hypothetical protein BBH88_13350 [Planococcus antarcticus DSM 14505]|uniref:LacI family transcriptional regulator n=1 Tax=Planococcus antarcticus DSM 14505 TaxID=1185653 RepID=A0ABM6D6E9_9BACL|nr:LacI family DNA-binding transcriptional regulator [Planococcus antarcticus]ANU11209.1 hypothetical protein BBH88_13350 [Planococcus antarcticus DSM 14505]
MKKSINAYDVAKKAGVSQSTVSRVLNDYQFIKKETKEKVLKAIEELEFTRDEIARSLANRETRTIGLIVGDITNAFFSESAKVITRIAQENDYNVILCNTNHDEESLVQYIDSLKGQRVDGIIIAGADKDNKKIRELFDQHFPVILYNSIIEHDKANYVAVNNYQGARLAVEHLYELGHRDIGYIAGPEKYVTTHLRNIGFESALTHYNLKLNPNFVYTDEFLYEKVYAFTKKLLRQPERPSCLFVASDQMALAVLDAASSENIEIPSQLSVIGFDNISLAGNSYIGLSTVAQPMKKMARLALENLIVIMERKSNKEVSTLPVQIVLDAEVFSRKTTGVR